MAKSYPVAIAWHAVIQAHRLDRLLPIPTSRTDSANETSPTPTDEAEYRVLKPDGSVDAVLGPISRREGIAAVFEARSFDQGEYAAFLKTVLQSAVAAGVCS